MICLLNLTSRNALIAAHDALATAVALVGSFYIRFEGNFADRLPLLLNILPYFIAFSLFVCYFCHLTTTKWRFISLPDALNILRAATVLALTLLVLDYIFVAPNVHGMPVAPNVQGAFFSARSRSSCSGFSRYPFSAPRASPTAIFAIRACGVMRRPRTPRPRFWWAAPRMPKSCCGELKAAR